MTETYGPATVCEWHSEWDALPHAERASLRIRQGVRYQLLDGLMVANPKTMQPVPSDGVTQGEVFFRGNLVMTGYLKDAQATADALAGGWFHSGDLAVVHPDGYIQLKDRLKVVRTVSRRAGAVPADRPAVKDIIISGGENISSVEVENVLYHHPAVLEAAVVAYPDAKWSASAALPAALPCRLTDRSARPSRTGARCRVPLSRYARARPRPSTS